MNHNYHHLIKYILFLIALCIPQNAFAQENDDIPVLANSYNINIVEDESPIVDLYFTTGIYTTISLNIIDFELSFGAQYYIVPNDKIGIEYTIRNFIDGIRFYNQHDLYEKGRTPRSQVLITNEYRLFQGGVLSLWAKNGIGYTYFVYNIEDPEFYTIHALPLAFGLRLDWQPARVFSLGFNMTFTADIVLYNSRPYQIGLPVYCTFAFALFALFHI